MKSLDQYETPLTDAAEFDTLVNRHPDMWAKVVKADDMRDLERRLAAQTECLNQIANTVMTIEQIEKLVEETLTMTAKP